MKQNMLKKVTFKLLEENDVSSIMHPPKRFRINAKNVFLTYAQCSLQKEDALQQLLCLQTTSNIKFVKIARELYSDGHHHLHILIQFEGKINIQDNRFFDLQSPYSTKHFHPNIQSAKSSYDVSNYIAKDGDTLEWGTYQQDGRSARGGRQTVNDSYAKAFNAQSKDEMIQLLKNEQPRDLLLQFHNISANWDRIKQKKRPSFRSGYTPDSFRVPPDIQLWLKHVFKLNEEGAAAQPVQNNDIRRVKSIIIEGPSRTGKIEWARSLGYHNYISGHLDFNLNVFTNDATYNVIDEVAPRNISFSNIGRNFLARNGTGNPIVSTVNRFKLKVAFQLSCSAIQEKATAIKTFSKPKNAKRSGTGHMTMSAPSSFNLKE